MIIMVHHHQWRFLALLYVVATIEPAAVAFTLLAPTKKVPPYKHRTIVCGHHTRFRSGVEYPPLCTTDPEKTNNKSALEEFIALEKERLKEIIDYEKSRLGHLNEFINSEKKRLKKLEKQERKYRSMSTDGRNNNLAFALSLIDPQRQSQKRSTSPSSSTGSTRQVGWTKLTLDPITKANGLSDVDKVDEFVYLYEPSPKPSMIIMFLGGAGLGQFPHITYSEMLSRIAHRLNAAIITAPYEIGLDHYDISKNTGVSMQRAILKCQESSRYSSTIPKFFLGHSLGCKLLTISTAAMSDILGDGIAGVGLISYNNFGFIETTKQVKSFTDSLDERTKQVFGLNNGSQQAEVLEKLLDLAEKAVTTIGVEFSPPPSGTERIINSKYDQELLRKTRLFVFDDDDLDSSKAFVEASMKPSELSISGLPGSHLAPVYINLSLNDLEVSQQASKLAENATGNVKSISYGDEEYLISLVDEVCGWINGCHPKRGPSWQYEESYLLQEAVV